MKMRVASGGIRTHMYMYIYIYIYIYVYLATYTSYIYIYIYICTGMRELEMKELGKSVFNSLLIN